MPKPIKLLVTDIDGESAIHTLDTLAQISLTEDEADACFAGVGYWLTLTLKENDFGDQQRVVREAAGDESVLPLKRFVAAVEKIERRECGAKESSLPAVTEDWLAKIKPPALGNVISAFILDAWYPTGSKTADFIAASRKKQNESGEASK